MKSPSTIFNGKELSNATDLGDMREWLGQDIGDNTVIIRYDTIEEGSQEFVVARLEHYPDEQELKHIRHKARLHLRAKQYGEFKTAP